MYRTTVFPEAGEEQVDILTRRGLTSDGSGDERVELDLYQLQTKCSVCKGLMITTWTRLPQSLRSSDVLLWPLAHCTNFHLFSIFRSTEGSKLCVQLFCKPESDI